MPAALTLFSCVNRGCTRRVPRSSRSGLCWGCEAHWLRWTVPTAGYISSFDLVNIANEFIREVRPTKAEEAAALRILRGPRHRDGSWDERPAYRLQPLLHRNAAHRRPHLLVGRRKAPSLRSLGMGVVHYVLANTVLGTRGPYSQFLCGATYYCRKGPIAPKGAEVLTGGAASAGYRCHVSDYSTMGREVLKAAGCLGVDPKSRTVSDRITSLYFEGLAAGRYHPAIVVPHGSFRTTAMGDHPLDHRLGSTQSVPRQYHQKIRRASGMISREWPEGFDDLFSQTPEERRLIASRPRHHQRVPTCPAPDTGWLFQID